MVRSSGKWGGFMSDSGPSDRRDFYRLRYPETDRPKLSFDNMEYHVVEISELGARIHLARRQLSDGRKVAGWIRFSDGEASPVEGSVLRTEGNEAVIQLSLGVTLKRMLAEQRRLIHLYPILFERSEIDPT
jgi:hypothetical protein